MTLRHGIEYAGVRLLIALAGTVSPETGFRLGGLLGELTFRVIRTRRHVVMQNLVRAFGDGYGKDTMTQLAQAAYRHLGQTAVEHARLLASRATAITGRVEVNGADHLAQAVQQGRGAVLVTGHFGHWELLGATVAALGYPISVVAKDQHNPAVNRLINEGRERLGLRVIPMASATHAVVRALRRNECVGLLVDQDAGPGGTFVQFLGAPASTYQGPALFALRTGAPIIPCFIVRTGVERHQVVFEPPIQAVPADDEAADIQQYTQQYTTVLERYVRAHPDHWFWVHRRWKTAAPREKILDFGF
ncbi:MAG: lysophospholipid acyltransferase family protein [Candidatus Latescibacteria bacterium]|nr:lysophospholipid acyltransferase family protein [Candidatus Latescibacterota bacterium]